MASGCLLRCDAKAPSSASAFPSACMHYVHVNRPVSLLSTPLLLLLLLLHGPVDGVHRCWRALQQQQQQRTGSDHHHTAAELHHCCSTQPHRNQHAVHVSHLRFLLAIREASCGPVCCDGRCCGCGAGGGMRAVCNSGLGRFVRARGPACRRPAGDSTALHSRPSRCCRRGGWAVTTNGIHATLLLQLY